MMLLVGWCQELDMGRMPDGFHDFLKRPINEGCNQRNSFYVIRGADHDTMTHLLTNSINVVQNIYSISISFYFGPASLISYSLFLFSKDKSKDPSAQGCIKVCGYKCGHSQLKELLDLDEKIFVFQQKMFLCNARRIFLE